MQITHRGIITSVGEGTATVVITPTEAECSGCAISRLCSKSEQLTVPMPDARADMVGREVRVRISARSQRRATVLFFVVPVCLLIVVLGLLASLTSLPQIASAGISLMAVALWYAIMYACRRRISPAIQTDIV